MTLNKLFFVLIFLFNVNTYSQETLNSKRRVEIINSVSQALFKNYVYPDLATKMDAFLKKNLNERRYNNITDPIKLSDILLVDLMSIYPDKHLLIQYNPVLEKELSTPIAKNQEKNQEAIKNNFGLNKLEILKANIGYLEFNDFSEPSNGAKEVYASAFRILAHTNAIIIDLRTNTGGNLQMVNYLASHFFKNKIHLNDIYDRPNQQTTEFWTTPDTLNKALFDIPVYILVSRFTFSAAEESCYDLQNQKRATIIGEITGGGAHPTKVISCSNGIVAYIPYAKAINPISKTNWEGTGISPDIKVNSDKALETAQRNVFENLLKTTKDSDEIRALKWDFDLWQSTVTPITIDTATLKSYAGIFGERTCTFENGCLYYQRAGRPKFKLSPMTNLMLKGNDYFRIEFIKDKARQINQLKAYYQDGRIEYAERKK